MRPSIKTVAQEFRSWGAWVVQSVERPTVMGSSMVGMEPAGDSLPLSLSLYAPLPCVCSFPL